VAINGNEVVIVEVKNKLKRDNVDNFIDKQIPNFKILFPQYKDYKIY
jgi:Cdc6-like AAA superfamily ATPase